MIRFHLGTARADITPDWSLALAGFAARTSLSEGVAQPLHVRVAVLESETPGHGCSRVVVVSGDILWWGPQQVPTLRREIARIADVSEENILLTATHTHSGPQTSTRASAAIGIADTRFLDLLQRQTLEATALAVADLEPVTITRFDGTYGLGFNRRLDRNPEGAEDHALTVVRFSKADGEPKALFVHYTCHPVITEEYLISSEFSGVAMNLLETRLGVTALYLQGCCGDINPDISGERRTVRGTDADVERHGGELAAEVLALLGQPGELLTPQALSVQTLDVDLPFSALPSPAELETGAQEPGLKGEWFRALLSHPEWLVPEMPLHLQRLDIANGLSLLAMNGEVVVAYGLRIRQASNGTVLPLGYANGMTGYIPTAQIIAEGGYEAGDAIPYFFLPAPFNPSVEHVLNSAIDSLISG